MILPKLGYYLRPITTSSTIKNTVPTEPVEGYYIGFSASGQDVWTPYYDYDGSAIVLSAVGAQCGKTFAAEGKWGAVANTIGFAVDGSKSSSRFFWYVTNQTNFWEKGGSAQPYVKVQETLRKKIKIPDLPTQRAIADFLDRETARIDLLIEKKEKMVEVLGEKRKNIINQATTIGFELTEKVNVGGKWLTNSVPDWTVAPLKRFVTIRSGYAFKAENFCDYGTPLVRMNNLKRGNIDLTEAVSIPDSDYNHSAELCAGDILLGMSGSIGETGSLGNFALVKSNELPLLLNQRVGRLTVKQSVISADFLMLVIQSSHFLDPLFLLATSTAQFNVSPSQIGSILISVPPRQNQENIVNIAMEKIVLLDELNFTITKSIQNLNEYRSSLITAAVTGQIDINDWQKSGAGDRRLDALQERLPA